MSSYVHAVVLAGGRSRRFGADKLSAPLDTTTVLGQAIASLPAAWDVFVVGPSRLVGRPVRFVDEEPPGSGPGAALVAGARAVAATSSSPDTIMVTLPGDAPAGGAAAVLLVEALLAEPIGGHAAIIGVDPEGQFQPLQIAVRGVALTTLAAYEPASVVGASARRLVTVLDPRPVFLPGRLTRDIDTPEDLTAWESDR